jgi:hypothetical protein
MKTPSFRETGGSHTTYVEGTDPRQVLMSLLLFAKVKLTNSPELIALGRHLLTWLDCGSVTLYWYISHADSFKWTADTKRAKWDPDYTPSPHQVSLEYVLETINQEVSPIGWYPKYRLD